MMSNEQQVLEGTETAEGGIETAEMGGDLVEVESRLKNVESEIQKSESRIEKIRSEIESKSSEITSRTKGHALGDESYSAKSRDADSTALEKLMMKLRAEESADEHGLLISDVVGTGPDLLITKNDVEGHLEDALRTLNIERTKVDFTPFESLRGIRLADEMAAIEKRREELGMIDEGASEKEEVEFETE